MDLQTWFDDFEERDWQEAEEGTVRFAMVGVGWWTREFAIPATEESDLCETTVAVTSSEEKAAEAVEEHDCVEQGLTYEQFHDGEATDAYDAVYVATPNTLHLPHVEAAADLGKDVLCEKPMESTLERAERLVEAAEGVTVMVAYRMQTDPAVRRMRHLVREGFVGEPAHVHGHMSQDLLGMNDNPDQWRLDPEMAGPGTSVTDLGIYPINTARFVLDADPVSVQAMDYSEREEFGDVPDERAAFTVEYEDGVLASLSASQNAHNSGYLTVTGTEGELTLEPAFLEESALTVERGDVTAAVEVPGLGQHRQMLEEFDYFADRVLTGGDPHPDAEHGLADVATIEAVYEAAESGEIVEP